MYIVNVYIIQQISVPMSVEFEEINKQREANDENLVMVDFTDEEGYGKYLDLHECYNKFLNIKGIAYSCWGVCFFVYI